MKWRISLYEDGLYRVERRGNHWWNRWKKLGWPIDPRISGMGGHPLSHDTLEVAKREIERYLECTEAYHKRRTAHEHFAVTIQDHA